jgi:hypothetical protein
MVLNANRSWHRFFWTDKKIERQGDKGFNAGSKGEREPIPCLEDSTWRPWQLTQNGPLGKKELLHLGPKNTSGRQIRWFKIPGGIDH